MNIGALSSRYDDDSLDFPYFVKDKLTTKFRKRKRPSVYELGTVLRTVGRFKKAAGAGGRGDISRLGELRVKTFPSFTAGYSEIDQHLTSMEVHSGFTPHVILVDYVGIMSAPRGYSGRDVHDYNTKMLKALAEDRKALVVSAIQGTRKTLSKILIGGEDVPEDIRQLANADVMIGLNQTGDEKEKGYMRLNVVAHRFKDFSVTRQVAITQQLQAAQFHLDNIYVKAGDMKEIKKKGGNGESKTG
jgi:hypothetical protein